MDSRTKASYSSQIDRFELVKLFILLSMLALVSWIIYDLNVNYEDNFLELLEQETAEISELGNTDTGNIIDTGSVLESN